VCYPLPQDKFQVIYADPPWTFQTWSEQGKGRSAENHYACMTLQQIRDLPVADLAAENCSLFLWTTDPVLPQALDLIKQWGFTYKTIAFVWAKLNKNAPDTLWTADDFFTGMGYWTRANSELCLLATKGKPQRQSASVRRLVVAPRREHSRKPDEVAQRIVKLMGDVPRIELFARTSRQGWAVWGNEPEKFVNGSTGTFDPSRKRRMGRSSCGGVAS
tara:strand:+ start:1272 stop:1922 length:651 start_codon:yes stop_codon:yes gene_type:complete